MPRLALCLLLAAACGRAPEPPKPAASEGAPPVEPATAAAPEPAGEEAFPAERLSGIVAEMEAAGAPYGLSFSAEDLRGKFQAHVRDFRRGFAPHDAKAMGLPEPETREWDAQDKEKNQLAKWLKDGAWQYGGGLPRDGTGIEEAWTRVIGSRHMDAGNQIIVMHGIGRDQWRR